MKKRFGKVLRTQHTELSLNQYQNIIWKYTFIWQIQMYYGTFICKLLLSGSKLLLSGSKLTKSPNFQQNFWGLSPRTPP